MEKTVSGEKLESLKQRAIQLAYDVFERKVDIDAAIATLLQQVKQVLGPNVHILGNVESLVQKLKDAVREVFPDLASTSGKRNALVTRPDFSKLFKQLLPENLHVLHAAFPQHQVISTKKFIYFKTNVFALLGVNQPSQQCCYGNFEYSLANSIVFP
jgi:hypothetical protein